MFSGRFCLPASVSENAFACVLMIALLIGWGFCLPVAAEESILLKFSHRDRQETVSFLTSFLPLPSPPSPRPTSPLDSFLATDTTSQTPLVKEGRTWDFIDVPPTLVYALRMNCPTKPTASYLRMTEQHTKLPHTLASPKRSRLSFSYVSFRTSPSRSLRTIFLLPTPADCAIR
ncbi:hypothetical protein CRENBAI_024509 [Crenichthys baileyi]|uniref:Uncharacterized protein n=1 Tax=Crenichthys baileyi TaxID=28760 RepID=A0AAV9RTN9_9TELE